LLLEPTVIVVIKESQSRPGDYRLDEGQNIIEADEELKKASVLIGFGEDIDKTLY
jgi:hypothetical protein